jgi:hypothetical protein
MKYQITWTPREGGSSAEAEDAAKRSLDVFSKWTAPDGLTFHQFLTRLDTRGGYATVETDDPMLLTEGPAKFAPWFDFEIVPVMDMAELVPVAQEAIEFRGSIT